MSKFLCMCIAPHIFKIQPAPYRYENTERRAAEVAKKGLGYLGMGVSGGEEGARNGVPYTV